MDIQGAELDVLFGASDILNYCNDIILELQHVEYNIGAPTKEIVINYLEKIGFSLLSADFSTAMGVDGDYHFRRKI